MNEFSTFDVAKILDIKRTRIQEWINSGYITPSIQKAKGKGLKAIFSLNDLYCIQVFRVMREMGIHRNIAKEHADICFDNVNIFRSYIVYEDF